MNSDYSDKQQVTYQLLIDTLQMKLPKEKSVISISKTKINATNTSKDNVTTLDTHIAIAQLTANGNQYGHQQAHITGKNVALPWLAQTVEYAIDREENTQQSFGVLNKDATFTLKQLDVSSPWGRITGCNPVENC